MGTTSRSLARQSGGGWWKLALALVVFTVWAYLFVAGDTGLLKLRQRQEDLADLESRVAQLEAENDSLRKVLWGVEHDPAFLERLAREELGMVRPGEQLYRVDGDTRQE